MPGCGLHCIKRSSRRGSLVSHHLLESWVAALAKRRRDFRAGGVPPPAFVPQAPNLFPLSLRHLHGMNSPSPIGPPASNAVLLLIDPHFALQGSISLILRRDSPVGPPLCSLTVHLLLLLPFLLAASLSLAGEAGMCMRLRIAGAERNGSTVDRAAHCVPCCLVRVSRSILRQERRLFFALVFLSR